MNETLRILFVRRKYGVECPRTKKIPWNGSYPNQCIEPSQSSTTIITVYIQTRYHPKWSYIVRFFLCANEPKQETKEYPKISFF